MNDLLSKQKQFLELLAAKQKYSGNLNDPSSKRYLSNGAVVTYIKEHAYYMMEEVNELILAIGDNDRAILKPWSTKHAIVAMKRFEPTDATKEEAIDMLCFCMNICLAAGLTPENIKAAYEKKWLENMNRQNEGY